MTTNTEQTQDPTASYSKDDWATLYQQEQAKGLNADQNLMRYAMARAEAVADPKTAAMRAAYQATQQQAPAADVDKLPNLTAYLTRCRQRCQKYSAEFRGK